jgi:hypothetical protein
MHFRRRTVQVNPTIHRFQFHNIGNRLQAPASVLPCFFFLPIFFLFFFFFFSFTFPLCSLSFSRYLLFLLGPILAGLAQRAFQTHGWVMQRSDSQPLNLEQTSDCIDP